MLSSLLLAAVFAVPAQTQDQPRAFRKVFSLLPAQTLNLRNRNFHRVEIRSEYPIQIAAGDCQNDYTVQWTCTFDDPADLFIRDRRNPPILLTPRANSITVTMSEN